MQFVEIVGVVTYGRAAVDADNVRTRVALSEIRCPRRSRRRGSFWGDRAWRRTRPTYRLQLGRETLLIEAKSNPLRALRALACGLQDSNNFQQYRQQMAVAASGTTVNVAPVGPPRLEF